MKTKFVIYKCVQCNGHHRVSEYMKFLSDSFNKPIQHCSVKCYEDMKNDHERTERSDEGHSRSL